MPYVTRKDPEACIVPGEADADLRDTEVIPFNYPGGIETFMKNEIFPYTPDAWIDDKKTQVGYEISFTRDFYKPITLRSMKEILQDLRALEASSDGMLDEILGGVDFE